MMRRSGLAGGSGGEQPFLEARHVDGRDPGAGRRLRRRAGPERRAVRPSGAPDPAGEARRPAAYHGHAPPPRRAVLPRAHGLPVAPPAAAPGLPAVADDLRLHAGPRGTGRGGDHPPPPRGAAEGAGRCAAPPPPPLGLLLRARAAWEPSPSAAIVDTQSVKTTEKVGLAAT